ncbi:MAG: DUF465 domain-containing protein [Lactobacillales bacterium]|jgi:hypothetical protein|nr:DUF465 domain-containing protein [Lactobacillales bacterium]
MKQKLQNRLDALKAKLKEVECKLIDEEKHISTDDLEIQEVKKNKLLIEDEIDDIEAKLSQMK